MLLALFNLSINGNILFERTRVISIISNMKMFFINNISDHGVSVNSRSRIIFFQVFTIVKLQKDIE